MSESELYRPGPHPRVFTSDESREAGIRFDAEVVGAARVAWHEHAHDPDRLTDGVRFSHRFSRRFHLLRAPNGQVFVVTSATRYEQRQDGGTFWNEFIGGRIGQQVPVQSYSHALVYYLDWLRGIDGTGFPAEWVLPGEHFRGQIEAAFTRFAAMDAADEVIGVWGNRAP